MAKGAPKPGRRSGARTPMDPGDGGGLPFVPTPAVSGLGAILGQEGAVTRLRQAMANRRVHHAFVFHGPAGVGKFTTAMAFACELLDPGDGSPASMAARRGTHPDLHVIRKELAASSRDDRTRRGKQTNLPIEVLREFLVEPIGLAPAWREASAAHKVFIVDEAELIDVDGQNALLKTLEEPPAGSVIILVTPSPDRLLSTVRSRCQAVAFFPLDARSMASWIDGAAPELEAARRQFALGFAEGSPGRADLAIRCGLDAWQAALMPLLESSLRGEYSPVLGPAMAKLVDEQAAGAQRANPDASKEAANRLWGGRMLAFVARELRGRLRDPRRQGPALAAIELVRDAERAITANVRATDAFENLAVQLAAVSMPLSR